MACFFVFGLICGGCNDSRVASGVCILPDLKLYSAVVFGLDSNYLPIVVDGLIIGWNCIHDEYRDPPSPPPNVYTTLRRGKSITRSSGF
jgi:hypothetical protein